MRLIKKNRVVALLLLVMCSSFLAAQPRHYITIWGAGGYSTLLQDVPYTKSVGGPGALVGFGYELTQKNFLFTLGAEFDYSYDKISRDDFRATVNMKDTEGDAMEMHYNFTDFQDHYSIGYLNVPIYFGGKFKTVYFLVGGKIGINLLGNSKVSSHLKTTATYPWALEEFQNMPDHFLTDLDLENEYPISFNLNIMASAEIGYLIPKAKAKSFFSQRVGLFVDYGLLNIHNPITNGNVIGIPANGSDILNVELNPLMLSDQALESSFNPFTVGIKYTMMFEIPVPKRCKCLQTKPSNWFKSTAANKKKKKKK